MGDEVRERGEALRRARLLLVLASYFDSLLCRRCGDEALQEVIRGAFTDFRSEKTLHYDYACSLLVIWRWSLERREST